MNEVTNLEELAGLQPVLGELSSQAVRRTSKDRPLLSAGYHQRFQNPRQAEKYAARFSSGNRRRIHLREANALSSILDRLPGGRTVLDIPCGAGRFLDVLTRRYETVIGMDISEAMLQLARGRAQAQGASAQFQVGDAGNTGLQDESIDCVFSNRLLHHFRREEDRVRFLREFFRISKRHVLVSFFDYRSWDWLRQVLKRFKGRKLDFADYPTMTSFANEAGHCGFRLEAVVDIHAFWGAEKYVLLTKRRIGHS